VQIQNIYEIKGVIAMDTQEKSMQFMQIAMKYLPQAKEQLDQAGVELSFELIQPFMELFTKVMQEAYELGREEALKEVKQD
jgi:competence protein ComZ